MVGIRPQEAQKVVPAAAGELNNLLQIISGTLAMLENVWAGSQGGEKYFAMLRLSVDRAAKVTEEIVRHVGGAEEKIIFHPALTLHPASKPGTPIRISHCLLVVDDEPMALELSEQLLTDAGFAVVPASSGLEALDRFSRAPGRFDLVLLDFNMPLMDGEETFQRIRKIDPTVPVLLNTGFIEPDRLERMLSQGLTGYLRRPYRSEDAIAQIQSILACTKRPGRKSVPAHP